MRKVGGCVATFFSTTGCAIGASAAGSAAGAGILEAAGWHVAGMTVASTTTASVIGSAVILGPVALCLAPMLSCFAEDGKSTMSAVMAGGFIGASFGFSCLSATAVSGAAMTGTQGVGLGFVAAAGAAGGAVIGIGTGLAAGVIVLCAGGSLFALAGLTSRGSEPYNHNNDTLHAVEVEVRNGKIVGIKNPTLQPVTDANGKFLTMERLSAQLIISQPQPAPAAVQMR